jgi:hypothetical protein
MENIVKFTRFDDEDVQQLGVDLDELYEKQRIRDELKTETFQKILKRIYLKIKHVAKVAGITHLFYQIPEYLVGNPRYDYNECVQYIQNKLDDNQFKTKFIKPNIMFITWSHYIPQHQRTLYKMKTGISIDGFGNVIGGKKREEEPIRVHFKVDEEPQKKYRTPTETPKGFFDV